MKRRIGDSVYKASFRPTEGEYKILIAQEPIITLHHALIREE